MIEAKEIESIFDKKLHEKLDLYSHFESLKTMLYPESASLDIITQNEQ